MTALLTLAQSLGIDPGPLNQTELQEQTCSAALDALIRAAEILRTSTAEHSRMWKESRQMESERNNLAAKVERLRSEFPLFDDDGLDPCEHHCEWAMQQDRKRLHLLLSEPPPAALAALKAQWQAEALERLVNEFTHKWEDRYADIAIDIMRSGRGYIYPAAALEFAREIRQRAQEAGDE